MSIGKWCGHIEACEASGLGKAAYARKSSIDYSLLIYWCEKYDHLAHRQSDLIEIILYRVHIDRVSPVDLSTVSLVFNTP